MSIKQIVLTYLIAAPVNEQLSFPARATRVETLERLKNYLNSKKTSSTNDQYRSHIMLALDRMKAPEKATPTQHTPIPPGAPIGCDQADYSNFQCD